MWIIHYLFTTTVSQTFAFCPFEKPRNVNFSGARNTIGHIICDMMAISTPITLCAVVVSFGSSQLNVTFCGTTHSTHRLLIILSETLSWWITSWLLTFLSRITINMYWLIIIVVHLPIRLIFYFISRRSLIGSILS